jgi:hypothetical protein
MKRVTQINMYRHGSLARLRDLHESDTYERYGSIVVVAEIALQQFVAVNYELLPQAKERANCLLTRIRIMSTLFFGHAVFPAA